MGGALSVLLVCLLWLIPGQSQAQCLQCWYDACIPDPDIPGSSFYDECCTCVLNLPQDQIDPNRRQMCQLDLFSKYRINSSDPGLCCTSAKTDFLVFYTEPEGSGNLTCPEQQSDIFNGSLDTDASNLTSVPAKDSEYIIPSLSFPCSGCISTIEFLTAGGYIEGGGSEELTVHLWYQRAGDDAAGINGDVLYERRGSFTVTAIPGVHDAANGSQVLNFTIGEEDAVCFQTGDVFGFSLPPTSNIPRLLVAGNGSQVGAYRVVEPLPYCEVLHSLFEPIPEAVMDGILQVRLLVTGQPEPTSTVHVPSATTVMSTTTRSGPVGTPRPDLSGKKSNDDIIIYIAAGLGGGALVITLTVAVVLNVILCTKWRGAKKTLLRRVRSRRNRASVQSMQPNLMYNSRDALDASQPTLSPKLTSPPPSFPLHKADDVLSDKSFHVYEELPERPPPPEYASIKS